MTTISLHKYHDQINQFLEDSQFTLAASHCRYILQQHPRHIDTYRLLAKTLIEQGDYSGATELFQRVLSADPNDYIAHAGLSVVYREEDVLTQSIWHLERAYEIEPYNSAIQQELHSLYMDYSEQKSRHQQGNGKTEIPDKLPLTKGALARLYIQGELYAQAIDVLHEALAEDEDRIDLEVLLTEALWRDNQRVAAVQVCLQVLEKLPNCITVNAVLAEIWLQTGRTDEAQQYLHDLQALTLMDVAHQDLETPAGSAFQPEGAMALPVVFEVERMGDGMISLVDDDVVESASEDGAVATAADDDDYQWLEGLGDDFVVDEEGVSSAGSLTQVTDSDWLRHQLAEADEETAVSDDLSSWLEDIAEPDEDSDAGALAAGAIAAGVIGAHLTDDTDVEDVADDDMLDWLSQEDFEEDRPAAEETAVAQAEEAEDMPDWLTDMAENDLEAVQMDSLEASDYLKNDETFDYESEADDEGDDIYSWLDDAVEDDPVEELEAGGLDLSQFAEFGEEEPKVDDDEEIVWRLTDELNPPEAESGDQDAFDFEDAADETGGLEDIPDWLMGSSGTDELDAVSSTEVAGNELADELAEWVNANQPEVDEDEDLPDWLSAETDASDSAAFESADGQLIEPDEEDDFVTSDLPSWMVDSSAAIDESGLLESAPLITDEVASEDSAPLDEAELPDWLMGGNTMAMDDSGLLDTGKLPDEADDNETPSAHPDLSEELPDWLSADDDDEEDDSGTAVVGGLLGAMAAGFVAKELLDDEDEDETQPEPLIVDSSLEDEVMEDAVSDKQDDLIGPQDELENLDMPSPEESDEFDWLDDLDGESLSVQEDSVSADDLDWMNLDDDAESEDLNLDTLLGLEMEEETSAATEKIEDEAQPAVTGLAEDESLDWLDALADDEPEPVDEMPTWQWAEDDDAESSLELEAASEIGESAEPTVEDIDSLFSEEPVEADVVEDLDDAMSWLDDLAAEPDAPVEELPSVAEDMDLDALFALDADLDGFDDLSSESVQSESLDEIFAIDTQNDSWLTGLADADEEPLPDFLEEDAELELDSLLGEDEVETAVSLETPASPEPASSMGDDMGEPLEDVDDAMAWLEKLAARQGAPLDELPSVEGEPEDEDDGIGVAEVVAGAAALGALGAVLHDSDDADDVAEPETAVADAPLAEEDLLAMDVPEDPDEAMAWLEKLAARQGAPLDELPSVSEDDEISAAPLVAATVAEDDSFALDGDEADIDDLLADTDDDALDDLDDAMAWLDGLEDDDDDVTESAETTFVAEDIDDEWDELVDFDFGEEERDLFEIEETVAPDQVEEPVASLTDALSNELDWLESIAGSSEDAPAYNPEEISVSDDELAEALEKLTLLTVAGAAVAGVASIVDEEDGMETAVPEAETLVEIDDEVTIVATEEISSDDIIENMPEDPDEAMAWLEKLAARQGAPLDELPSVEQDEYDGLAAAGVALAAAETIKEEVEPDPEPVVAELLDEELETAVSPEDMDIDDAMAWLEQLAARQGTSLDELPTVDESDLEEDVATPDWVDDAAKAQAEEEALLVEEAIVEELEEEDLTIDTPMVPPEDMDMDDAMAWLEQLAARQGTSLDELPTVVESDLEGDVATPDWVAQQPNAIDDATLDSLDVPDISDETLDATPDEDFFAALDEVPAIEGIETDMTKAGLIEDIDDSMPDWLADGEGSKDDDPLGHTGWLNSLDEPDMDSWLASEAEATMSSDMSIDAMPEAVDTDSLIGGLADTGDLEDSGRKRGTGELRLPDDTPRKPVFTTELDEAQLLADLDLGDFGAGLDQAQLESARNALAGGDIEAALHDYQGLVETGDSMHTVIADLERASELHQDKPMVRRMLGDAYMRNGQINRAIETYRDALDQM